MLTMDPTLLSIILVPDAMPRLSGGAAFMTDFMFGELKRLPPIPAISMRTTNHQNGVLWSMKMNANKLSDDNASPTIIRRRAPRLSAARPAERTEHDEA